MSYKNITIEKDGSLGLLTLSREKEKNSLDIETSKEIYEGLKELESDNNITCIAIKGNEKLFSPGADIKELGSLDSNLQSQKVYSIILIKLKK
mgnify:CR=1 FL=1